MHAIPYLSVAWSACGVFARAEAHGSIAVVSRGEQVGLLR